MELLRGNKDLAIYLGYKKKLILFLITEPLLNNNWQFEKFIPS
jgi:hypothetical protein